MDATHAPLDSAQLGSKNRETFASIPRPIRLPAGRRVWYVRFISRGVEEFMKKLILAVAAVGMVALAVLAALKVGDKAPDFSARAFLAGEELTLSLSDGA